MSMIRYDGYHTLKPSPFLADIDANLFNSNDMSRSASHSSDDGVEYVADPEGFLPDVSDW